MTRKIIAILLAFVSCHAIVKGQINKNSVLLGGQFYYQSNKTDDPIDAYDQKSKSGTFNVAVGTAVKNNSVFGVNLTYAPSSNHNYYNGGQYLDAKANQYSIGVFNRQYKRLAKDLYFYAETELAYTYLKREDKDTLGAKFHTVKESGGQLNLTPGVAYKIFNKMYVEVMIPNIIAVQYLGSTDDFQNRKVKQNQFSFNSSLNSTSLSYLGVGFRFVL